MVKIEYQVTYISMGLQVLFDLFSLKLDAEFRGFGGVVRLGMVERCFWGSWQ